MSGQFALRSPRPPAIATPGMAAATSLSGAAFSRIADLAHREAGLFIAPGKTAMVRTRLARRLRALNLPDFEAYCDLVDSSDGATELAQMISALTTNVSQFFREQHHFDFLRDTALPLLLDRARSGKRIRIWSAGCSNGQEPYSIALALLEAGLPDHSDVRILATDIDPAVVKFAHNGAYPDRMATGLPSELRDKYFGVSARDDGLIWTPNAEVRSLIRFRKLNLLHDWPMRGQFDIVFCRNVVIYFDTRTQNSLWDRFARVTRPNGWLILGHSERVGDASVPYFETAGITTYRRTSIGVAAPPRHAALSPERTKTCL